MKVLGSLTTFPPYLTITALTCPSPRRASWKTEPQDCGKELIATPQEQVMTSYNYPLFYPGGLECLHLIKTQKGRVITLEILDFDLENGS